MVLKTRVMSGNLDTKEPVSQLPAPSSSQALEEYVVVLCLLGNV